MFADRTRWNLGENRLSLALAELRKNGAPILDLTRSNPTECGFTYELAKIQRAFSPPEILHYVPDPRGMPSARDAICSYYRERGISLDAGELLLTSGTSEGYSFVFRMLCNPGDEVLIPSPGYPLFDFLADLCDVKLVRYPLLYDHGWQIDFSALADAASERARALIVVHPNNPTGHYASAAEQNSLVRFCVERGIALIADEVFLDFSLDKNSAASFAGREGALTFTLSGLSKIAGMPQMKLAWIAVNGPTQQKKDALARLEVIADAYLSVGTPVQLAAPVLLGMRADFHAQAMARIHNNLRELDGQLACQSACNRLLCEGGWSAVLRVPAVQPEEDLAISLLTQKGVYVHPGHFYDFSQPGYIVVSLIVPEKEFAEGIRRALAHFA
ncbi:MAG TPA: pyridoxal phosphate-dependent aminotransferase [Candidatus Acidoferrum sp.]|jgi:aspartate/methionine/tyrosine aminotransferase